VFLLLHSHQGPGAEANLLCQQSVVGARGEIPGLREIGSDSSVLSAKTSPLLLEFFRNSNDRPSNSQGLKEARCGRQDGAVAVELSKFDVQYEPRGPIKGQVYADFVVKLSSAATQ